jgi:Na+-translocating ferredoxin:NAD+ oxidoreductase RnfE subunit
MDDMDLLFGPAAVSLRIDLFSTPPLSLALLPPGAFLIAALAFAAVQGLRNGMNTPKDEADNRLTTERP